MYFYLFLKLIDFTFQSSFRVMYLHTGQTLQKTKFFVVFCYFLPFETATLRTAKVISEDFLFVASAVIFPKIS